MTSKGVTGSRAGSAVVEMEDTLERKKSSDCQEFLWYSLTARDGEDIWDNAFPLLTLDIQTVIQSLLRNLEM